MCKSTVHIFLAAVSQWRVKYEQIWRHKNPPQHPDGIKDITHVSSPPLSCDQRRSARRVCRDFPGCLTCCDWPSRQPARLLCYPEYQVAASVISTTTTESEVGRGPPETEATCESPACGGERSSSTSKCNFLQVKIYIFHFLFLPFMWLSDLFYHFYSSYSEYYKEKK